MIPTTWCLVVLVFTASGQAFELSFPTKSKVQCEWQRANRDITSLPQLTAVSIQCQKR